MPVYDQTADVNFQELHRLSKLYPFPDWVKTGSAADAFQPDETLPANAFGDSRSKQFPCHTKVATFFSTLYFLENRNEIPVKLAGWIDERLQKFASHHGITNQMRSLREKYAELHADATSQLPDSAFALVRVLEDGHKDRRYMLRNSAEVKVAAQWLLDNRDSQDLTYGDRRVIATKILEKAAQFGASLGDKLGPLERQAGQGIGDPKKIAESLRFRLKAAEHVLPAVKAGMIGMADAIEQGGPFLLDVEKMASLCGTVVDFDRATGLDRGYGERLKRPEDVFFEHTFKEATAFTSTACELQTGSVYDPAQFEKLSYQDVANLFGEEFIDQVSTGLRIDGEKMATLARTMPRNDAAVLERLMSASGMTPVVKHAAAVRSRVSKELLASAAENYHPVVTGSV